MNFGKLCIRMEASVISKFTKRGKDMKRIAVILCGMEYDNQQEFMQGIVSCSREYDGNTYVFIGNTGYLQSEESKEGAFQLYKFMNPQEYDGAILFSTTIHYEPAQTYIIEKLRESGLPVISITEKIPGMGYMGFNDYEAMRRMVSHVIKEHGKTKIAYINGPEIYYDVAQREKAFRNVMEEEGLSIDRHWFFQGDFNVESGMEAVDEFERTHRMPEAIICANDSMAAGVVMELQDLGYRVPEDVIVTGFDDVRMARENAPRLTTVRCERGRMGYLAYEALVTKTAEEIAQLSIVMETEQIYSESCGCVREEDCSADELKRRILREMTQEKRFRKKINEMFAKFVGFENSEDFLYLIRNFIPELRSNYVYVACRDVEVMTKRMVNGYDNRNKKMDRKAAPAGMAMEKFDFPLVYKEGAFSMGSYEPGQLFPRRTSQMEAGTVYYVMPLHYRENFFGYCILGNYRYPLGLSTSVEILYQIVTDLGNAIESILKRQTLQRITEKLNRISAYDELTGLYNRIGFQAQTDEYRAHAVSSGRSLFMSFIDIDGLKNVNDTYGHHAGDNLIRAVADCLHRICRAEEICMRFGGDEFVVFGLENVADSRHTEFEREFGKAIKHVNEIEKREYTVSASIGSYVIEDVEHTNLQVVMERADMEMYLRKRARKKKAEAER